jgi:ferredoxin-NADP reductase
VAHVFGPPPMVDAVAAGLRRRGLGADRLRADAFTPGALDLDGHGEGR